MDEDERLFNQYLARELNFALRKFDFATALKWKEQLIDNKANVVAALKRELARGERLGFRRYRRTSK